MNFIYFNPDEMRADLLGCYGHPLVKTPNFDRLAEKAVRFDQCHVQHTVCSPSRCSFVTGWYPHVRGHRSLWHLIQPDEPNTFKYLKQNGYDVHVVGKNDVLSAEAVPESITKIHFEREKKRKAAGRLCSKDDPLYNSFLYEPLAEHARDYDRIEQAVEMLESWNEGDSPFMLFVASIFPHCPYTVPEPWYSMYDPEDIPDLRPVIEETAPRFHKWIRKYRRLDELTDKDFRRIMAVYLGMISYVDFLFGKILDVMDKKGLWDNTSLFFFSDHGDWGGDYGLVEKWASGLDDTLTRIPMIVYTPDCKAGHVVEEQIECFDIVPTTLELAGIKEQHSHQAVTMMPQLKGAKGDPERIVVAEGGYDLPFDDQCFEGNADDKTLENTDSIYHLKCLQQREVPESVCRSTMIRTMKHKLIRRTKDINELYDLEKDPMETVNVYDDPEYCDIRTGLEGQMLDWYIRTSDVTPYKKDNRNF